MQNSNWRITNIIKRLVPSAVKKFLKSEQKKLLLIRLRIKQKKAVKKVRKKKIIKVAFFSINISQWKYEKLYFLLKNDDRFDPVVFVCPFILFDEKIMNEEIEISYNFFKKRGYNVMKTIKEDGSILDVKKVFQPDLIFFTSSWDHTYKHFLIDNFLDTLTAYVPYSFNSSSLYQKNYNRPIHNYTWKYFVETDFHKKWGEEFSQNKGRNIIVTGYPGLDQLIDNTYIPKDCWKPQKTKKKRIIWAPHHTIPGHQKNVEFSNFLTFAKPMLEIADEFQDSIQIAFKPHPNLKGKLYTEETWGKSKTDTYYEKWENLTNGQLEEGGYIDLFLTSDAMIHDSRSFILEYLVTLKPVLFLVNDEKIKRDTNLIGIKAFNNMYIGNSKNEIVTFIKEVILDEKDPMFEKRKRFFKKFLTPPENKQASEYIYELLIKELVEN